MKDGDTAVSLHIVTQNRSADSFVILFYVYTRIIISLGTVAETNKCTYVRLLVLATISVAQFTARDHSKLVSLGVISLIFHLNAHVHLNICIVC